MRRLRHSRACHESQRRPLGRGPGPGTLGGGRPCGLGTE